MPPKRKLSAADLASVAVTRSRRTKKRKVPTLRMAIDGPATTDPCGGFRRRRHWVVDNPEQGLIIQHVTRTFTAVREWDPVGRAWNALAGAAIDTYVTDGDPYATQTEYWEAWEVDDAGDVTDNEDSFALCSIIPDGQHVINTTRGTFTISGRAMFYPTELTAAALGFTVRADVPAGMIASRDDDPSGDLATDNVVGSGAVVGYEVEVTWNSRHTGPVPTTFAADGSGDPPYIPDSVYTDLQHYTF